MAVRRIDGWHYVDFYFQHKRYRKRSPVNSKGGAEAYEATLRHKLAHGEPIEVVPIKKELTFGEYAPDWLKTYSVNNKPSEQGNKQIALDNHLIPFFGRKALKDIGMADIERFKHGKTEEELRPKTINNLLCTLSRCLRSAVEWELLDHIPIIKPLKVPPQPFKFLSLEESTRLIACCDEPMWKQMILIALRTGMRLGELFGLDWSAIDFQRRQITVRQSIVYGITGTPKNNKIRHIPITDEVCSALYESRKPIGLVFHRGDGEPLSYHVAERAMHRACKKAGLPLIGWHVLRHTFASDLATEGIPMRAIQELLGHASIVMTMRYAHLGESSLREAVATLEQRAQRGRKENFGQQLGSVEKLLQEIHLS